MPPSVFLELRDAPVADAVAEMFKTVGAKYRVEGKLGGKVTLERKYELFDFALRRVLRVADPPMTYPYRREDDVYVIQPYTGPLPPPEPRSPASPRPRLTGEITATGRESDAQVTINVTDAPLRQVLEEVFQATRADYQLDIGVKGTVTIKIVSLRLEDVLRLLLLEVRPPLTWVRENGVYIVRPRLLTAPSGPVPD